MRHFLLVLLAWMSCGAFATASPALERLGGPRVRPADARTAALLRLGLKRSATLRALARQIEERDVIVYVEMQPRLAQRFSGCISWMSVQGRYRYLRASLNPDLSSDQRIAALGHELRHVLEIADTPSVKDATTLLDLYRAIGFPLSPGSQQWDTTAARAAGNAVRHEMAESMTRDGTAGTAALSGEATWNAVKRSPAQRKETQAGDSGEDTRRERVRRERR